MWQYYKINSLSRRRQKDTTAVGAGKRLLNYLRGKRFDDDEAHNQQSGEV